MGDTGAVFLQAARELTSEHHVVRGTDERGGGFIPQLESWACSGLAPGSLRVFSVPPPPGGSDKAEHLQQQYLTQNEPQDGG